MARLWDGQVGENWVGVGGRWAAKGRLNPLLGLLGLAMRPRSVGHRPKHA